MATAFDELREFHETYIAKLIRKSNEDGRDISPQLAYSIGGKVFAIVLSGDTRMLMRGLITSLTGLPVEWLITFNEGYCDFRTLTPAELAEFRHGGLERRFKAGDPFVKEIVILNLYTRSKKLSIVFDKSTGKKIKESSDFGGFLTVQDCDLITWADWKGYGGKP